MRNTLLVLATLFFICMVNAQVDSTIIDIIDFESPYPHLSIDSSTENSWRIGIPQKSILDSAYSPVNVIITDTFNSYSSNDSSYFDIRIGDFNAVNTYHHNIFFNFKHKYDTDTLKDGGYISVSYDNGVTFNNIITDPNSFYDMSPTNDWLSFNRNLYTANDSIFNDEFGFSGTTDEWITTWFGWYDLPVKSTTGFHGDTLIVRFNFVSDSIDTGKEGWMIDDINLINIDMGSAISDLPPFDFNLFPNPSSNTTTIEIEKYKDLNIQIIDLNGRIVKQANYSDNQVIQIDHRDLKPSIYLLKLKINDKAYGVKTLVIE